MQYDAIILAGGESSSELKKIAPYDNEALIIIGNYPMIYFVYNAVRQCPGIRKIVVSGPVDSLRNILPREELLFFVPSGNNAVESLANAVELLKKEATSEKILIMPTDIPFITREAIEDFIKHCEKSQSDFYYPLTSKETNEKAFPGVKRTYVRLKEGVFTGGNLFMVKTQLIDTFLDLALKLVIRRKNPLAIARLFGLGLVWKFITGTLSLLAAEKRFHQVTGIKGKAIISTYAQIGVDVDKPSDLDLAQEYLGDIKF
ncbi:MAG: NTP transferase domain-containing protein [Syntrophomonadaceae bacterium]|jgi:GTP:adenosylcobinamide-phosphate guanylyltransferase|nr:NTP transferase domain-containing protein [Syntrophomonadaceae bacterium]